MALVKIFTGTAGFVKWRRPSLKEFFLISSVLGFYCPYCFTCAKLRTVSMVFFFKNKVLIDRVAAGFPNLRRGSNDAGQSGVSRSSPWPLPADVHEVRTGVRAALVLHVSQAEGLLQSGTARRPEQVCPIDPDRERGENRPGEEPAHPVYGARVADARGVQLRRRPETLHPIHPGEEQRGVAPLRPDVRRDRVFGSRRVRPSGDHDIPRAGRRVGRRVRGGAVQTGDRGGEGGE